MIAHSLPKVIITSYLFPDGAFSQSRLDSILQKLGGDKDKLVIDLSCRKRGKSWLVAMNKWQTLTDFEINQGLKHVPLITRNGHA